jgi:hypothetical protein
MKIFDVYEKSGDKYRYALGTKGEKTLFCLGINPSTATDEKTDPTITRVKNVAYREGKAKNINFKEKFDSFVMLNIYPLRATNPDDLPDKADQVEHEKNIKHILNLIKDGSVIWAAWGNLIHSRNWLNDCLNDILCKIKKEKKNIKWVKMGELTDKGNPRHPLFVKYQEFSEYVR